VPIVHPFWKAAVTTQKKAKETSVYQREKINPFARIGDIDSGRYLSWTHAENDRPTGTTAGVR
jgi:hypothetical protein